MMVMPFQILFLLAILKQMSLLTLTGNRVKKHLIYCQMSMTNVSIIGNNWGTTDIFQTKKEQLLGLRSCHFATLQMVTSRCFTCIDLSTNSLIASRKLQVRQYYVIVLMFDCCILLTCFLFVRYFTSKCFLRVDNSSLTNYQIGGFDKKKAG